MRFGVGAPWSANFPCWGAAGHCRPPYLGSNRSSCYGNAGIRRPSEAWESASPAGPGGVGEGSGWRTPVVPQGEGNSPARRQGCYAQGARRDAKVLVCSEGSQKASCSHRVKKRKENGKGREYV